MIKTVSLTPETFEFADRKPNFSKWVQEQLIKDSLARCEDIHVTHPSGRVKGLCNGLHQNQCLQCYPDGPPTREEWRAFRTAMSSDIEAGDLQAQIRDRVEKRNARESRLEKNAKKRQKRGFMSKLFRN